MELQVKRGEGSRNEQEGTETKIRRINNYMVIGGEGRESQRLPDLW